MYCPVLRCHQPSLSPNALEKPARRTTEAPAKISARSHGGGAAAGGAADGGDGWECGRDGFFGGI
jgi:hypothetical protein